MMGAGEDSLRSKFVVVLLMKGVVWLVTTGTCSLERLEGGSKVNHNIGIVASDVGRKIAYLTLFLVQDLSQFS